MHESIHATSNRSKHPGADACWGPNLWFISSAGVLRLSGDGRFAPVEVGRGEVARLLRWSSTGLAPDSLAPQVTSALALRGWRPEDADRSSLGSVPAPPVADLDALVSADDAHPRLIRVVRGRTTIWDERAGQGLRSLTDAQLLSLAGEDPDRSSSPPPAMTPRGDSGNRSVGSRRSIALVDRSDTRVPVWFATCTSGPDGNPLALGMIQSALVHHDGGVLTQTYDFRPIRISASEALGDVAASDGPGLLLLSNFHWTLEENLRLAAEVKQLRPGTLTVFGGPSAPKYEGDVHDFFRDHPQADIIVHGEGEVTAVEIFSALDGRLDQPERLVDIPGLTVRVGDALVRTADRDRMADPNVVPSPYLTGLFDHLVELDGIWVLETNRGCPYGCTYCDWGSATMSRVRQFDLDRVLAEIDWLSEHRIGAVMVADANFGMFRRDIDIARRFADLKQRNAAPASFIASFAKNTTKHTLPIVEILQDAGLHTEATLSFQTVDEQTLINIRRQNVKQSVYDELTDDARARGLPLLSDLMLGLPGMSLETMKADFEHCMLGDVTARVFGTLVLPNSPMNDPDYRQEHGLLIDCELQLVGSNSFTPADREEMVRFRDQFRVAEHFGVLREVLRFASHETGRRAVDVLWDIYRLGLEMPERFPLSSWFSISARRHLTVPMAWAPYFDEIHTMLVEHLGIEDSTALSTVLAVQQAVLPTPGRGLPRHLTLAHDYVAYRHQGRDEERQRLGAFGPGELTVDDPMDKSVGAMRDLDVFTTRDGHRWLTEEMYFMDDHNWELRSPLERDFRGAYLRRRVDLAG